MTPIEKFIEQQLEQVLNSDIYGEREKRTLKKLFPVFYRQLESEVPNTGINPDTFNDIADAYAHAFAFMFLAMHNMLAGNLPQEIKENTLHAMINNFELEIVRLFAYNNAIHNPVGNA
jgi:hypothetical protein